MNTPGAMPPPPEQPDDQPPPTPRGSASTAVLMALVGVVAFAIVNAVIGFGTVLLGGLAVGGQPRPAINPIMIAAIVVAVLTFGGGGALCFHRSYLVKGLGIGLMIGWALVSIVTAGFCTGLNPTLYDN